MNPSQMEVDPDPDVDEVDAGKNADLDVEEDEPDEEASQQDEEALSTAYPPIEHACTKNKISRPTKLRMNKTMRRARKNPNLTEMLLKTKRSNSNPHIEPKHWTIGINQAEICYVMRRERVYVRRENGDLRLGRVHVTGL